MARRVIRRRRPAGRRVVRRASTAPVQETQVQATAAESEGTTVLMATTNSSRNLILPKMATMSDIRLAGLADTPENALKMLVQEHPEVVVFDMDFGGDYIGLDTARMMQKTRTRAAIVMLVPELDVEQHRLYSRRFGSSWSYVKQTTAARVDVLETVLKSAVRGVQWIEPELSRILSVLWKTAEQARDLEAIRAAAEPTLVTAPAKLKTASWSEPEASDSEPSDQSLEEIFEDDEDEIAPGIKTKSTSEADTDGLNITSVSVGHGGIGQNVGKIRRTG